MTDVNYKRNKYISKLNEAQNSNDVGKMKLYSQKLNYYNKVSQDGGGHFDKLIGSMEKANNRLEGHATTVDGFTGKMNAHEEKLKKHQQKVNEITQHGMDLLDDIGNISVQHISSLTKLKEIDSKLHAHEDSIQMATDELNTNANIATTNEACIKKMIEHINTILGEIDQHKDKHVELQKIIDNMDNDYKLGNEEQKSQEVSEDFNECKNKFDEIKAMIKKEVDKLIRVVTPAPGTGAGAGAGAGGSP